MARIKIYNPKEGVITQYGTEVYCDDKQLERVRRIDFSVSTDEIATFRVEIMGSPDIEMDGRMDIRYTPETISDAFEVIADEYSKSGNLKITLRSAIEEILADNGIECKSGLAAQIADGIFWGKKPTPIDPRLKF